MTQDQASTILHALFEIKKDLGTNTEATKSLHERAGKIEDLYKEISSKLNGHIYAHQQFIEQRVAESKEFATREINLLRSEIESKKKDSVDLQKASLSAKSMIVVAIIGAIGSLVITLVTQLFNYFNNSTF